MGLTRFLRKRSVGAVGPVIDELIYLDLFREALRELDLPFIYRPFGAGANASMLFLTLRCVQLHRPARVLDLGAGQTSLLLDALAADHPMEIHTIEGDPGWHADISERVRHAVHLCPVEARRRGSNSFSAYRLPSVLLHDPFDLILVDGPGGARRFGRAGVLDVIPDTLSPRGVVVFDDADRRGERDTIAAAEARLAEAGRSTRRLEIRARGCQVVLAPEETPWLGRV
jgi:predicted O-methyltransferase YrrM